MALLSIKSEKTERLKLELMDRYILLMLIILTVYFFIFTFYIHYKMMSWYLLTGIILTTVIYPFLRKKFSPNRLVRFYLIVAPIYNFYIMLAYWNNSVAGFCWLLPIPLGAYIFFPKKEVLWFTAYTLLAIVAAVIVANTVSFDFPHHSQKEVMLTDIILFVSNILVITLLLYYKDKIKKQEFLHQINNRVTEAKPSTETVVDTEGMQKLFERIESAMSHDMLFKDVKLNLSKLSVALDVNSSYISKAIRYKGYPNFNTYLNIYRIEYVKKLITEIDFQKATLMYIYTEAGFSNQSTFNRVFKQIEGITPSEYIQQNLKINPTPDL